MATLTMPGPQCPAPPAFSLEVPDTWRAQLTSGALADVVFTEDPTAGHLTVRHLVLESRDQVAEVIDGYRTQTTGGGGIVDAPFEVRSGGRTATAINTADDRSVDGIARIIVLGFFAADEGGDTGATTPHSGLILVGAAAGPAREERYAEMRDMVLSATFGRLEWAADEDDHDDPDHTDSEHTNTEHTVSDQEDDT